MKPMVILFTFSIQALVCGKAGYVNFQKEKISEPTRAHVTVDSTVRGVEQYLGANPNTKSSVEHQIRK